MRPDAYDSTEMRTPGDAALAVACVVGTLMLAVAGWVVVRSEPVMLGRRLVANVLIGVGGFALFGATIAGIRARRRVAVIVTAGALAVSIAAVALAPWLHWRLSQAAFDRVATGAAVACEVSSPCKLGWWNVERSELRDGLVIVWTTGGDMRCYAGHALAKKATDGDPGEDVMRGMVTAARISARVTAIRDGWYELCLVT